MTIAKTLTRCRLDEDFFFKQITAISNTPLKEGEEPHIQRIKHIDHPNWRQMGKSYLNNVSYSVEKLPLNEGGMTVNLISEQLLKHCQLRAYRTLVERAGLMMNHKLPKDTRDLMEFVLEFSHAGNHTYQHFSTAYSGLLSSLLRTVIRPYIKQTFDLPDDFISQMEAIDGELLPKEQQYRRLYQLLEIYIRSMVMRTDKNESSIGMQIQRTFIETVETSFKERFNNRLNKTFSLGELRNLKIESTDLLVFSTFINNVFEKELPEITNIVNRSRATVYYNDPKKDTGLFVPVLRKGV